MNVTVNDITTQREADGSITLVVDGRFGEESVTVLIPAEALANRRRVYRLRTGEEALAAILREHARRIGRLPAQDAGISIRGLGTSVSSEAREVIERAGQGERA